MGYDGMEAIMVCMDTYFIILSYYNILYHIILYIHMAIWLNYNDILATRPYITVGTEECSLLLTLFQSDVLL